MIDQLFSSKTRVKLLKLFLKNPNRPFYVREITRKIYEQINSVRRELANLLDVGIIRSEKVNNKLYYEVNQKSKHYEPLRDLFGVGTSSKTTKKSSESAKKSAKEASDDNDLSSQIQSLGNIQMALLTGSFTRDNSAGVDLLIVGDVSQSRVNKFIDKLEKDEGREIMYTILRPSEYEYRLDINDRFLAQVLDSKYSVVVDSQGVVGPQ